MFRALSATATRSWSASGCGCVAYVMRTCLRSRNGTWIPGRLATLSHWVAPSSEAAAKERIAKWSANDEGDLGFAIETLEDPPMLVGHVGLWGASPKDRCATLGIALGREHIGRGYGSDAMRVMVGYAFRDVGDAEVLRLGHHVRREGRLAGVDSPVVRTCPMHRG